MTEEWTEERKKRMRDLASEYDVPLDIVIMLADMMGPNEDYDGLICALEDYDLFYH